MAKKDLDEMSANERTLACWTSEAYGLASQLRNLGWPAHRRGLERCIETAEELLGNLREVHFAMPTPGSEIVAQRVEEARAVERFKSGVIAFDPDTFQGAEWFSSREVVPAGMAWIQVRPRVITGDVEENVERNRKNRPFPLSSIAWDVERRVEKFREQRDARVGAAV